MSYYEQVQLMLKNLAIVITEVLDENANLKQQNKELLQKLKEYKTCANKNGCKLDAE